MCVWDIQLDMFVWSSEGGGGETKEVVIENYHYYMYM